MRTVNGKWIVEYTDEFETWWSELTDAAQDDIDRVVLLYCFCLAVIRRGRTIGTRRMYP